MAARSRNKNGTFRRKRRDTHLSTLRGTYDGRIPGGRSDKHLGTTLKQTGDGSLSSLVNKDQ